MSKQKSIIIGSGIGGLSSAIRLSNLGYECVVYESNKEVGGKVASLNLNGFRFDKGPSLFTLPELVDNLFVECGENPDDYYTYSKLDVITKYFFENGKVLEAHSDPEILAQNFEDEFNEPKENVLRFLANAKAMYEATKDIFLFNSMHKFASFKSKSTWHSIKNLGKLNPLKSMDKANNSYFEKAESTQIFNRYATYNGSNPFLAPNTLNIIAHLEHNIGAYYLDGGMYTLTKSLTALAGKKGVEIKRETPVEKILVENNQAIGVRVNGENQFADIVVSNTDVKNVYEKLMPEAKRSEKVLNQPRSTSALIFYWGVRGIHKSLDVHNILFSQDYEKEFDQLSADEVYNDPTVYIYISSKASKSDAPEDCENWFVMINVPHDSGQDWDTIRKKAKSDIISKVKRQLNIDLEAIIIEEDYLDPPRIEEKTSSVNGSLYGSSSNNMWSAFLRHPNFSRKIKNLYFSGGSVHPGGGIPLCLASAKIIEKLVQSE